MPGTWGSPVPPKWSWPWGKVRKGPEGKREEMHSSMLKMQPKSLRSSGVGCNAVRVEMKAVCLREGFEVYENKALLHYQCPAELFPQCASNNITPHRKSINTLKL